MPVCPKNILSDWLSVGLVIYRTPEEELHPLLETLSRIGKPAVAILDNGESSCTLSDMCNRNDWQYLVPNRNIGFGAGHNAIFQALSGEERPYHLLVNPDIEFDPQAVLDMVDYMEAHQDIGLMMPDVRYPDASRQLLCKLLPSPMDLIARRFFPDSAWKRNAQARYELHDWPHDDIRDIPSLSGCFMLIRSEAFRSVGGFDERFFLYLEDFDLCRRIGQQWRTVYYPQVQVVHRYAKGSYRSRRLLALHIRSAIKYFNKWGWFFDAERKKINLHCLKKLNLMQ